MGLAIRKVENAREQQSETFRYWRSRPDYERMDAVAQIVRDAYALKGIDLNALPTDRSLRRVDRSTLEPDDC
jgi:hypothetical protein